GRDRMPHIGSDRPDEAGLKLVEQWIASLNGAAKADPPTDGASPTKLLENPTSALSVARKLGRSETKPAETDLLLAEAPKLAAGPVRDLFDGYFPSDGKGRKLGSNPRPKSILALKGDPVRGEKLFWSQAVNCGSCHKIGDRGAAVGPDLSTIGKQRPREDLLE